MPLIERKTLDRVNSSDILYLDAGNLIKAGQKAGNNTGSLAKFNVSFVTIITPTKEETEQMGAGNIESQINNYIEKKGKERSDDLRVRLKETLLGLYVPFSERDQSFLVPGKKNFLTEDDLLSRKLESLNFEQVSAGSSRLINKYKLKFCVDIMSQFQGFYNSLKPLESGKKEQKGYIRRLHVNSIRLNSWYDDNRFRTMGDSLVNQSIDTALLYLHTFTNLNKKRIADELPLSDSRYDPKQKTAADGIYQYKPEFILEASIGVLLYNLGYSHQSVHKLISGKPFLDQNIKGDQKKIKTIQKSINVMKHLLDREDISSISKMVCTMQKEYPDGTGFPSPNKNKYLYEFVRLLHIIDFYDHMTNPVLTKTPFSRMDVINYLIANSGKYSYTGEKFNKQPLFDSNLLTEFLDVLAPFDINEKVYIFNKDNHNQHLFLGKVVSYSDSYIPLISILKDEKRGKEYRDGSVFMHIPSSSLYIKKEGKTNRKQYSWIKDLEIFDKKMDAGNISDYIDNIFGKERPLHKNFR